MRRPQARGRRRGGFTLIEVLLVLAILVIIASLAVMAYGPARKKAKKDAALSQIGLLNSAIELYNQCLDQYPTKLEDLRVCPTDLPDPSKWEGPYLGKDVPKDPWGYDYQYVVGGPRNPTSYDLWSLGPDGVNNTDDDIWPQ
jgi:general secretion pathway protein G